MFGLLGVLGAVVAGFFVDAMVAQDQDHAVHEDSPDQDAEQAGNPGETTSLLDDPGLDDPGLGDPGLGDPGLDDPDLDGSGAQDDAAVAGMEPEDMPVSAEADVTRRGGADDPSGDGVDWLYGGDADADVVEDAAAQGSDQAGLLVGGDGTLDGDDTIWPSVNGPSGAPSDVINGGLGAALLQAGAGDPGHEGEGADQVAVHDIAAGDPLAQITDFNREEDALVLLYDAGHHSDPEVTISTAPGSDHATVLLDGVPVAQVLGGAGLQAGDVVLQAA